MKWKTLASEYVYNADWFTARKDTCQKPDGRIIRDYYVLEFPEWVTALPITKEGKVLMVKQYRHALEEECIELPGGCVDATDNDFITAIKREMMEETGYEFEEVISLGSISSNPSTNNNLMHMFVATGGKKIKGQDLDHNEEIEVFEITFEELMDLVDKGRIMQSMHLSTIFYAMRHLGKINYNL